MMHAAPIDAIAMTPGCPPEQYKIPGFSHAAWHCAILHELPVPAFVIDREHRVILWNRACERLTGVPASEVLGTDRAWSGFYREKREIMADLVVDETIDERVWELYPGQVTMLPDQPGAWEGENYFPDMKGGGRWLSYTAVPLYNGQGEVVGAVETVRDLSIRKMAELAYRESEYRLSQIVENSPIPMFVIDKEHRITHWNQACEQVLERSAEEMIGRSEAWRAAYDTPRPTLADLVLDGADGRRIAEYYGVNCKPSAMAPDAWECVDSFFGGRKWLHFAVTPLRGLDGQIVGAIEAVFDVTQKVHYNRELEHRTTHDPLTGLPNRRLAMDRLAQAIKAAERNEHDVALMYIDLDGFKFVNDTQGHQQGDELLRQVAGRLKACLREVDTLARIGGDEFLAVLPDQDGRDGIALVADRLIDALTAPFRLNGNENQVSASIGVALYPDDGASTDDLIRNADAAMYRAKDGGKGRIVFFTGELSRQLGDRIALKHGLSKAMERGEFHLLFQPKSDLAGGNLTGFEALLRWDSARLGPVAPERFIPVLEETGQIEAVGKWVIEEAVGKLRHWQDLGFKGLRMAVNLSARQLWNPALPQQISAILAARAIDPADFELELTESMIMRETDQAMEVLCRLADMGIHLTMDDFGTGYSSLSYLKRFPLRTIKIDRAFIRDLAADPDDFEIVRTIITMGRSLKRRTIAEGVETEEQRQMLKALGCDEMQGYLLSRPLSAEAMTAFLKQNMGRAGPDGAEAQDG